MQELINLVTEKTGIEEAIAKQVIEVIFDQLRAGLPEPLADQVLGILEGKFGPDDILKNLGGDDVLGGLIKGLFG